MIKKIAIVIAIICFSITAFVSCGNNEKNDQKRGSSGKTLEILLVANKNVFSGNTKDQILKILKSPQKNLNQVEAMYDVVNIPMSSFENNDMFQAHRNIIIINVADTNSDKVYVTRDKWAQPQVIISFYLTKLDSVIPFLEKYKPLIDKEIKIAEHARIERAFRGIENYGVMEKLRKNFGFELILSNEYQLSTLEPNFAWVRKEAADFSIGFIIYTEPYTSQKQFDENIILNRMDTTMKRHIPGPLDGSYMATERRIEATSQNIDFCDTYCVETRGLWRLFGDFMGGPYVNYTFLSPDNKNLITITAYVYSPRQPKRDFLMQAESICYSIKFVKNNTK